MNGAQVGFFYVADVSKRVACGNPPCGTFQLQWKVFEVERSRYGVLHPLRLFAFVY